MFAGIYAFYTPRGQNTNNVSTLDTANKLGYSFNSANQDPHLGVALLTGQNLNFKALTGAEVLTGFTTQEKWDALSSGISVPTQTGTTCLVISAGPITLNNNDSVTVGFAIVKGANLSELKTNTITAKNKYGVIGVQQISSQVPLKFELYQNYPNPFNPWTTIRFDLAKNDFVNIRVFDVLGREVALILDRKLDAGTYKVDFDGSSYSSGVYFYRIETKYFIDVKRMVLIK